MTVSNRVGTWIVVILSIVAITAFASESKPDINRAPLADAGLNQSVVIGELVTLDAGRSSDHDGDRLKFRWTLEAPPGSGARLVRASTPRPQFTVDLLGTYTAQLIVSDGELDSVADTVTIRTDNVAPVAIITMETGLTLGEAVVLDGSSSWDVNGDTLDYHWSLIDLPASSRAALQSSRNASPSFVADVAGNYLVELTVSDGQYRSEAAQILLSTVNSQPHADAGPDRRTYIGKRIRLNGFASTDADGEALRFRWSLLYAPEASRTVLSAADLATPIIDIDAPGLYVVQLITHDGVQASVPDTMVIAAYAPPASVVSAIRSGVTDVDGDGIPDDIDNCAEHFNPSQLDSNGDGFGNRCDADLNNDGFITNFIDLPIWAAAFNTTPASPNWNQDADFNGDNAVNFLDLSIFADFFLMAPGPIVNRFIDPAGGSWHDPANWSLGEVPNVTHSARIDIGGGVSVEYSTGDSEIAALRSTTEMMFTGGTLAINGDMQVNAAVTLSGSGTIANANIVAPDTPDTIILSASNLFTLDNVTLGADLTIENAGDLRVNDDLTLSGGATITLASDNSFTYLRFLGVSGSSSTLGGTGEVVFGGTTTSDTRNNVEVFNSTDGLVVAPGVTIRSDTSGGRIYQRFSNGPVTIQGTVMSSLAGRTVTVSGAPLSIEGTLQGLNGGHLTVTPQGSGSSVSGAATMSGGGTLSFNAASGVIWTIDAAATIDVNSGELALFGSWVNAGTVSVTDGVLDIGNTLSGQWDNNGSIVLSNTTLELGGDFMVADVGAVSGPGTVIINGRLDNTGQTLDVGVDLPGTTVLLGQGGIIVGGSIGNTPLVLPASVSFTLENVTLAADLTIENNASMFINDDLTLSGSTITLASSGTSTYLRFVGVSGSSSTLGGTGEVVFGGTTTSDTRNNVEVFNSTDGLVVAPGVTIRSDTSGGRIYQRFSNGPVTIQGTVMSSLAGRTVTVSGAPLSIEGTLQGLNGGHLTVTPQGSGSSVSGAATMSGGGTLSFNAASGVIWTIDAAATIDVNSGELALFGSWVNAGTVSVTDGVLDIGNTLSGQWDNNGSIVLSNTTLELGGDFMVADVGAVSGPGTVIINGRLDNTGQTLDVGVDLPGTTVLLGQGGIIVGGSIGNTPLVLPASVSFTLENVTLAADLTIENNASMFINDDLTLSGSTITLASSGTSTYLRFVGVSGSSSTLGGTGEVVFGGTTTSDTRNNVEVFNSTDGLVVAPGVTIRSDTSGGRIYQRFSNGPVTIQGTVMSSLAGRTVTVSGAPLSIEGTLQGLNGGHLTVTPQGSGSSVSGAATMSGGGTLSFNAASGVIWTIDAAATIDVNSGELALFGSWVNAGTVSVTDGVLDIGNTLSGQWDNNGSIVLSNTTLELGGDFMVADVGAVSGPGTVIINGRLDNTGQTLDVGVDLPGTTVLLGQGGIIVGGSIGNTPLVLPASVSFTLENVTLAADLTIENNASMFINDDLTLSGSTITLASSGTSTYLRFVGVSGSSSTLGGTGEVVFGGTTTSDTRNNVEVFNSTDGLVVAPGVTIRSDTSGGRIYQRFSNGPVTIQGTVMSSLAGRTVTVSGAPLSIEGTLQGLNGGHLTVTPQGSGSSVSGAATMSGGGTLSFNAASGVIWTIDAAATIDVNSGELALFGSWVNAGTVSVTDGVLDIGNTLSGQWDNNGSIVLSNTTLELGGDFMVADVGAVSGPGTVIINGRLDNTGQTLDVGVDLPGTTVLLGQGGIIVGGSIGNTPLVLPASVSFTLENVTLAADLTIENNASMFINDDLTLSGSTITLASSGTSTYLRFVGVSGSSSTLGGTGEVVFGGTTTSDTRNNVEVFNSTDGLVVAPGVTIRSDTSGGRIYQRFSNGPVTIQGTVMSSLAGRTVTVSGAPLSIEGTLQGLNGGHLTVTPQGSGSSVSGAATMSGGGTLSFNAASGVIWTIDAAATIDVNSGELALFGSWVNAGTVSVTDGVLDIGNTLSGQWDNNGSIVLSNTTLELGGDFMVADVGAVSGPGTVIINGRLDNTGQTLDVGVDLPGTTVLLGQGGIIVGGSIGNTPLVLPASVSFTLENVTLAADLTIENNASMFINDDLTLSGSTITLASSGTSTYLRFVGVSGSSSTLGGTGEVVFGGTTTSDTRNNVEVFNSTDGLVVAPGVTIRSDTSGGRIYQRFSNGPVTIQGTVMSSLAGRTVTASGAPLSIEGTLEAGKGSVINFTSDYSLTGTAAFNVDVGGTATTDFGRFTAVGRAVNLLITTDTLNITLVDAFVPALGDTFEIMTFGTLSGTFNNENGTTIGGGLFFQVNYNATDVTLEVVN